MNDDARRGGATGIDLRQFPRWLRANLPSALISALVGGLVSWVANVWVMAVRYDGYLVPAGTPATGQGSLLTGTVFWALATMVGFSVVGYWRSVGGKRFWAEISGIPSAVAELWRSEGTTARVSVAWGAAVGLLVTVVLAPSMGLLFAVGFVAAAPTALGGILTSAVSRLVSGVVSRLRPAGGATPSDFGGVALGLLGACAALLFGFVVSDRWVQLVAAVMLAAAAVAMARRDRAPSAATVILVVFSAGSLLLVLYELRHGGIAYADDGGFAECGSSWSDWFGCAGSGRVRRLGGVGAAAGAAGGAFGGFVGSAASGLTGPRGPLAPGLTPAERDRRAIVNWVLGLFSDHAFREWRALHPELRGDPSGAEFERYMRWRHERGLQDPPLVLPSQRTPPIAAETAIDQPRMMEEMAARVSSAEAGPPERLPVSGDEVAGPATATGHELWSRYADGHGRIRDHGGYHIANVDPDGRVTDLAGNEVTLVQDMGERVLGYQRRDGSYIETDWYGNPDAVDPDTGLHFSSDAPKPPTYGPKLDEGTRSRWLFLNAGPNGELYGDGGRVIGRVDADGNLWTNDGQPLRGAATPDEGRIAQVWTDDGRYYNGAGEPVTPSGGEPSGPPVAAAVKDQGLADLVRQATEAESEQVRRAEEARRTPTTIKPGEETPGLGGEPGAQRPEGAERVAGTEGAPAEDGSKTVLAGEKRPARPGAQPRGEGEAAAGEGAGDGRAAGEGDREGGAAGEGEAGETRPAEAGAPAPTAAAEGETAPATTGGGGEAEATPRAEGEAVPSRPAEGETRPTAVTDTEQRVAQLRGVYDKVNDAKSFLDAYDHYVKEGVSPEAAAILAATEVGGGNAAGDTKPLGGVTDPRLSMVAGGLLPEGMQSALLPGKVVENYVRTGVDAWRALSESAGESWAEGQLDTSALDRFAEQVAERRGADPFSGYAQAAQLAGEEWERTDGGNVISDLGNISAEDWQGAFEQSAEEFQRAVEAGEHGTVLQGVNEVFNATAQVVTDPGTTLSEFANDVANIWNHGVGDGYWTEVGQHTDRVLQNTPVINTVYNGYREVVGGLIAHAEGETVPEQVVSAVTGFAGEMYEGAEALAGEAADALASSAASATDYIRSWF